MAADLTALANLPADIAQQAALEKGLINIRVINA